MTLKQSVFDRARSDRSFRDRLLSNPKAVLAESGAALPDSVRVETIDVGPNEVHLNLGGNGSAPAFRQVIERAATDTKFRERLLANPKSVVQECLADPLPANVAVCVHAASPKGVVRLFVPPLDRPAQEELSDAELSAVAGGGFFKNVVGAIREWACRDSHVLEINNQDNTYQVMTDTSHKAPTNEVGSLVVW